MNAEAWIAAQPRELDGLSEPALEALARQASAYLEEAALPRSTRSMLLVLRGRARGALADRKVARKQNGLAFLSDSMAAVSEDGGNSLAVLGWARVVRGMTTRSWIARKLIEGVTSVRIEREARRLVVLLASFPADATAQLLRAELARFADDQRSVTEAGRLLAALPADRVDAARAQLGADAATAARAQAETERDVR